MSKLVAITNITPDSFSDGDPSLNNEKIISNIKQLIKDGADIIDIGAESTRPGATKLTPNQEWQRLEPIIYDVIKLCKKNNVLCSIDTYHPQTAKKAVDFGVNWINDVSGVHDKKMTEVIKNASKNTKIVIMHNLGIPADKSVIVDKSKDIVDVVYKWLENKIAKLQQQGINKNQIIVDPGIGFGKDAKQSLKLIERAEEFKGLGTEILYGHSRKSFLTLFTDKPFKDRDEETLKFSSLLIAKNIDYLRIHNLKIHK